MAELLQRERALVVILAGFLLLGIAYSVWVPIFEISDEVWHYPMVEHLATTWTLPVQPLEAGAQSGPWRQEGSQPPLYYALAAALTRWIDTSDMEEVRQLNPQLEAGVLRADRRNVNLVVHNLPGERFPWRGTVLAVHIARLLSVLLGVWSVYLGWRLVRALFPEPSWLASATAALHAFTPMFIFITASVNNDTLVIPLSILALLLMVRLLKGLRPSPRTELLLGLVLGLAVLTKEGALGLLPLALATSLWSSWQAAGRPRKPTAPWGKRLLLSAGAWILPLLLVAGWWYWRNFRLYGDWLGLNAFLAVAGERPFTPGLRELWSERFSFMAAYWGNFGGLNVPLPLPFYHLLNGAAVVAGVGLGVRFVRWLRAPHSLWPFDWQPLTAARALAWAWPAALLVSVLRWTRLTMASQGRLVFPGLPIWSLGLLLGLLAWLPQDRPRLHKGVAFALPALLFALSAGALPLEIVPTYRLPAPLPAETPLPHTLEANFGGQLRLLGYGIETAEVEPGSAVDLTLYWEALAPTTTEHKIFVHLVGEAGRIVAQHDGMPGRGLLSTRRLAAGQTWEDRYVITVPDVAYAPDTLSVAVGVYDAASGVRLQRAAEGATPGDSARFGEIDLLPPPGELPNPVAIRFGEGMVLRGYDVSALSLAPGAPLTVTLHWEATAPMQEEYTVSVQVINALWQKAAQLDAWPLEGAAPTSTWQPGQSYTEERMLSIAADVPPGSYDLRLAVYRVDEEGALQMQPVTWRRRQTPQEHVTLTQIVVGE